MSVATESRDRIATTRPRRLPVSAYRLQFHRGFGFRAATRVVPYLERLGVTDLYASPLLAARPGSSHGYDVCDPSRIDPELGSRADREAFGTALQSAGMSLLLDVVPNHMSADPDVNPWWRDVLENGRSSRYARVFDVAWRTPTPKRRGRVVLPVLGDELKRVVERGELRPTLEEGRPVLAYFERRFPIDPATVIPAYVKALGAARVAGDVDAADLDRLTACIVDLRRWAEPATVRPGGLARSARDEAKARLQALLQRSDALQRHVEAALRGDEATSGPNDSRERLLRLLGRQAYELASWRAGARAINYRRFFDISDLIGVRVESPYVFRETHALILDLVHGGFVSGLRIDHIDGLRDPAQYLARLQSALARVRRRRRAHPTGARPGYVVVEKILTGDEGLRCGWATHGTTGYDFLNSVNGLFVRAEGRAMLARTYAAFAGARPSFERTAYESMLEIAETSMAGELGSLTRDLVRLARREALETSCSHAALGTVLRELVARFPVYRTYVAPNGARTDDDRRAIETALARMSTGAEAVDPSALGFLRRVLLDASPARPAWMQFLLRLQQCTGPIRAKGVEDTALYRDHTLIALNEVGGEPSEFGRTPRQFHVANERRLRTWPWSMTTTATHDTKLGEDVRARLDVLSEIPEEWAAALDRLAPVCGSLRSTVDGQLSPDPNDEYRLLQAVVGSWPAELLDVEDGGDLRVRRWAGRLAEYAVKAAREAKRRTSWRQVNAPYEAAVTAWVRSLLGPAYRDVAGSVGSLARWVARAGALNSLSQIVLKIGSPGVPDVYQGAELWQLCLVDPDNRRPVDFRTRAAMLRRLRPLLERPDRSVTDLLARWRDGRIKLYVTAAALRLRRALPELFLDGDYQALEASARGARVVAFMRRHQAGGAVIVVAGCHLARAVVSDAPLAVGAEVWGDAVVSLPSAWSGRRFRNVLTGQTVDASPVGTVRLASAMDGLPASILVADVATS